MEAVILAAGKGTRMRSSCPKVLHRIMEQPMLAYVLNALYDLGMKRPGVVFGDGSEQVRSFITEWSQSRKGQGVSLFFQKVQRGTGHAVMMTEKAYGALQDHLLVWPGDMPLVKPSTIKSFIRHHQSSKAEVSVLSSLSLDSTGYGRVIRAGGRFYAIREELDATPAERRIQEINTGIYIFKISCLFPALKKIKPENKKSELYLTDVIEILSQEGCRMEAFPLAVDEEAQGINSRQHLAKAVSVVNQREIRRHQENGVTFVSPDQTYVEPGVKIGQDTVVYPWCYLESGIRIGKDCRIGPFAKIRKGTRVENEAVIGSFVELNRSRIGKKVLAKHLAYLGDAVVGEGTNVGAGTITANFDGKNKNQTRIGKKVQIGSNTVLVAPVTIGDQVQIGAGSVVTARQKVKKGQVIAGVPARVLAKSSPKKRTPKKA